jgi:4-hydroxy-tetrahydrodipicolinate synthase
MYNGLYPILQTPFDSNGEVDYDSLRRLVQHVRAEGVEGIVFPGFVSEWWRLTDAEVLECASAVGEGFIGVVTSQSTPPALARLREFERMGAVGLMLLPPFLLNSVSPLGHIAVLLSVTSLPCILQDSAGLTGTRTDPVALSELALAHSNLRGVKVDQVPTGPAIEALRSRPGLSELSYLAGYSGVQWADARRRGASALMSGCAHIALDRVMLTNEEAYYRAVPLLSFEMQTIDMVTAVHKQLLFERGIIRTPELRAPSSPLDSVQLGYLRDLRDRLLSR